VDAGRTVLSGHDVLVTGDRIAAVGPVWTVPEGTEEIDATGGIVMPGMIDTHRHMWQTSLRGYGADWTLTQYFVWNYLEWGRIFRPEDVHAGNLLAALEALDAGRHHHRRLVARPADPAARRRRRRRPASTAGRFVLAYGNIHDAPANWTADPGFREFVSRRHHPRRRHARLPARLRRHRRPRVPRAPAFEVARELGVAVTTHAGVWGATNDDGVRLMHEHGFAGPDTVYVHAATLSADSYHRIAATGGSVSVSTESEQSAGQGYPPTWALREHGIPVSLSMDTSMWWSADLFSAMRTTLGADRSREHLEAHARGDTVTHSSLRAEQVVEWATRGGARAIGRESDLGSVEVGKKADLVLLRNDHSPVSFPLLNPHGHVAFQAQRGDVHTVLVDGRVVKRDGRLVDVDLAVARTAVTATVEHLRATMGEAAWQAGMNPEIPETKVLDNPYTYTDYRSAATHGG
jgi:cytosine/adenosine deaminase-related metal-dependent hydrolase